MQETPHFFRNRRLQQVPRAVNRYAYEILPRTPIPNPCGRMVDGVDAVARPPQNLRLRQITVDDFHVDAAQKPGVTSRTTQGANGCPAPPQLFGDVTAEQPRRAGDQ